MRTVWTGLTIAAAVVLGAAAVTALAEDGQRSQSGGLGAPPATQGESWHGTGEPAMW